MLLSYESMQHARLIMKQLKSYVHRKCRKPAMCGLFGWFFVVCVVEMNSTINRSAAAVTYPKLSMDATAIFTACSRVARP
jgi:hypothetical protein